MHIVLFLSFIGIVLSAPAVLHVGNFIYPSPADNTIQCIQNTRVCIGNMYFARNQ